jgi:hypothetical protein
VGEAIAEQHGGRMRGVNPSRAKIDGGRVHGVKLNWTVNGGHVHGVIAGQHVA